MYLCILSFFERETPSIQGARVRRCLYTANSGMSTIGCRLPYFSKDAGKPIATRTGFVDKDKVLTFRLQLPDECIDVTLAGPNVAEGDDLSMVFYADIGDCNG